MSKFLPTGRLKWIKPKAFDLSKYTSNISKGFGLEVDLEYPKELCELHNDYPLVPDKIEIKETMLSSHQLKIADLYNILISNSIKLMSNVFGKEEYVLHCEKVQLYLKLGLKLKHIVY